ncbi:hypothetical protein [Halocatena marina]|uniref:hypothetical protein n=1 Tax=Halocatena marina TaxID=2934937 RepID=UPI002223FB4A|nr:hypothetical protein [Halocatena marina]
MRYRRCWLWRVVSDVIVGLLEHPLLDGRAPVWLRRPELLFASDVSDAGWSSEQRENHPPDVRHYTYSFGRDSASASAK